jgi:hypothetical protein
MVLEVCNLNGANPKLLSLWAASRGLLTNGDLAFLPFLMSLFICASLPAAWDMAFSL